jgi:Ca-activated chloride channel family protein
VKASCDGARSGRRTCPLQWRGLLILLLFGPLGLPAQSSVPAESGRISVDVDLVVLHVTVRNGRGDFVSGLGKDDFHVFEDGRSQTIKVFHHEDMPVSLGLLVDNSTSMGRKRGDVTAAALAFVRSSNPQDEMFIVNFNERVSLGLPGARLFSASPEELERALNGVPARGMTALYDAIEDGLAHLKKASCEKKVSIVISDGGDNASHHKFTQVLEDARQSDAIIYTIGLFDEHDRDQNPKVLRKIARATGGEVFLPSESSRVAPICARIAADIRHQYTIGYVPSNQKLDNSYRVIRVTAARPHGGRLSVRTRTGYIASPERKHHTASSHGSAP